MRIVRNWASLTALIGVLCLISLLWEARYPEKVPFVADDVSEVIGGFEEDRQLFDDILATEMLRLNVTSPGFRSVRDGAGKFLEFVKVVESNGDQLAKAETTSAMSLYQFTIPSVKTAVNRLENYLTRHNLGGLPIWASELRENPKSLYDTPEWQQATLALINIAEQRGTDEKLRRFFSGEVAAAKEIYLRYHHTDPDAATHRRVAKIFNSVFK